MTTLEDVLEISRNRNEGALEAFWDNQPYYWETEEPEEFLKKFDESYEGVWYSTKEFSENLAEECDMIPEGPAGNYFDYDQWDYDLFLGDYWSAQAPGYKVYIFRTY